MSEFVTLFNAVMLPFLAVTLVVYKSREDESCVVLMLVQGCGYFLESRAVENDCSVFSSTCCELIFLSFTASLDGLPKIRNATVSYSMHFLQQNI